MAVARTFCNPRRSYIITGGLGGFGLELAQWLVDRGARHLVLTSRTGVRTGYQDSRVRHWRRNGVDVTVSSRDVTDAGEAVLLLKEAAAKASEGVGGVFNLAVVTRDGLTVNQTADQWIEVAQPKVLYLVYFITQYITSAMRLFICCCCCCCCNITVSTVTKCCSISYFQLLFRKQSV